MSHLVIFISFLLSLMVTFFIIPILSYLARSFGMLDIPDGNLKTHTYAIPNLGGVAIFLGIISSLVYLYTFSSGYIFWYIGLFCVLILGFFDDMYPLSAKHKLIGQMVAVCFLLYGLSPFLIPMAGCYTPIFITILFFGTLSIINSFNLVDVMDGLAASLSLVVLSAFFMVAWVASQVNLLILLSATIGAVIAFLWYNLPPAKIYLGDAGSLFLGALCSTLPFLVAWPHQNQLVGYITSIGIMGVFLLELLFLILIRLYKGTPIYLGSPDHFSIYLQRNGWKKLSIVIYGVIMSSFIAFIALLFAFNFTSFLHTLFFAGVFVAVWFIILLMPRKN